ncbi:MAG: efflux RND transporter periplasmic adaptor subunit [Anaerolineae bacterium]|nr:efflux RND transporter periplasmic adaptor subunit [Anaerolineae bacterium]
MRKILIWVLVLGAIGAAGFGLAGVLQQQSAAQTIFEILKSEDVRRGDLAILVTASGNVAVNERTDLLTRMPGIVAGVPVEVNEQVKAGQVLARMDTEDLVRSLRRTEIALELAEVSLGTVVEATDAEDIEVAELALTAAAKAVQVAQLGTETARIDADALRVQAQRAREQAYINLRDIQESGKDDEKARIAYAEAEAEEQAAELSGQATRQQSDAALQAARTRHEQAARALETLREGADTDTVRQQEILVEQARLRLEQMRRTLEDAALTAPHDGIVASIEIEEGTYQGAGASAFTLVDDSRHFVDVTIDEIDIGAITEGQTVEVILDAYPDAVLTGVVETIAPAASNVGGVVAYQVRVELTGPIESIRVMDGMTASVRITTETIPGVLLLPSWALRIDQDTVEIYTYVVEAGYPVRRTLETGQRNDTYTEILSGVSEGDTVALVAEERVPFNFFAMGGPPMR